MGVLHTHPKFWGNDSLEWKPNRWIKKATEPGVPDTFEYPVPNDVYCAWSQGPRVCIGRKFSQVEFIAVVARTLSTCRMEVVKMNGEDLAASQKRVVGMLNDSVLAPTKRMRDTEGVLITFTNL